MTINSLSSGFTDTQDNQKGFSEKYTGKDPGPYVGIVKNTVDPLKMGRLGVLIPSLSNVSEKNQKAENVIWCQYLSPFYGAKPLESVSKNDPYSYTTSQSSYGMWAVPPDVGTNVLVIFAKGLKNQQSSFWIGCIQEPLTNQMVPGLGASKQSSLGVEEVGPMDYKKASNTKDMNYGTDVLPIVEKNRKIVTGDSIENLELWNYPVNVDLANQLKVEGLQKDPVRGTTTSSARRETPSRVFGISTPGPIKPDSKSHNIGLEGSPLKVERSIGHSFVMDDGDENGLNQLTRIRTASGHQLLLHDTEGCVYIANGSGKSWLEMSSDGKIYIYANDGFNLRSDGNFDLHSGGDINFHAKNRIAFTSEAETTINSESYLMMMGKKGIFGSAREGSVRHYGRDGISSYSDGTQLIGAGGQVHLAGSQVHFNSTGASSSWGPTWLTPETAGIVTDTSQNDVNITVSVSGILEANSKETKTTVPNLVTHEPFERAPSAVIENVSQWQDPVRWKQLSETPGTLEYMAMQNRNSTNEHIKQIQFLADQQKYISEFNIPDRIKNLKITKTVTNKLTDISSKLKNKVNLNSSELKILTDSGIYDAREARIAGMTIQENILANSKVLLSKADRVLKGIDLSGHISGGNINLGKMKELSDTFTSSYNQIYEVSTVVQNLSKENIGNLLINKVTAGQITSVSIPQFKAAATSYLISNAGKFFSKGSANSIPPSMRGTMSGRIMQVANTFKSSITSVIGKWFSDIRLKENIQLVGKSPSGINIYRFKYKHTDGMYQGVMAQEVPEARQMTNTGFYMVDYSKLDVQFRRLN